MSRVIKFPTSYTPAEAQQSKRPVVSHFELSEEQEQCIYHARYTLQLVIDLACAVPEHQAVPIDPVGLTTLLCSVRDQLPTHKDMPFISG